MEVISIIINNHKMYLIIIVSIAKKVEITIII